MPDVGSSRSSTPIYERRRLRASWDDQVSVTSPPGARSRRPLLDPSVLDIYAKAFPSFAKRPHDPKSTVIVRIDTT
jgi:hypothetical protein